MSKKARENSVLWLLKANLLSSPIIAPEWFWRWGAFKNLPTQTPVHNVCRRSNAGCSTSISTAPSHVSRPRPSPPCGPPRTVSSSRTPDTAAPPPNNTVAAAVHCSLWGLSALETSNALKTQNRPRRRLHLRAAAASAAAWAVGLPQPVVPELGSVAARLPARARAPHRQPRAGSRLSESTPQFYLSGDRWTGDHVEVVDTLAGGCQERTDGRTDEREIVKTRDGANCRRD